MRIKKLLEARAKALEEMKQIQEKAATEERAYSEDEQKRFTELEKQINDIDATIAAEERAANISVIDSVKTEAQPPQEILEERAFEAYVMGRTAELRAGEQNITMGNNGAIIPVTIANRIIKKVTDICPILAGAVRYNVKGTLKVPVWTNANTTHNIKVGYQQEFTELTADAGKFVSVDLSGFLAGALVLIGKSVENNGSFSVVNFIINQMAEEIAIFIEKELLTGTGTNAAEGALNTTNALTAASASAITADELIELQSKVKQAFQTNACWTMNSKTFTAIKKLKDNEGRYLLQNDVSSGFPYRLLGKPVYISDNMPEIAAGAKTILYGEYSGLSVNFRENIQINVLREKYETMHAIGVVAWFEFDSRITDAQKLAVLVQKAS
ncbi:MAG: phage major capsid protein [Oscillospiraceae bacterium]|nr:phage major capsid protein [Oscillospiraceae bacterium]